MKRYLDLNALAAKKSFFLLGPRQTGKSWLIRDQLKGIKIYNLLESDTFAKLSRSPHRIREELTGSDRIIVIDEVQKLPQLLDEVQLLIEEKGIRFVLTGSSARKLRMGGANLLAGRALMRQFHPLCYAELGEALNLHKALACGLLPSMYLDKDPIEALEVYAGTYLKEEVVAEGAARNIPAFSRFLEVAALYNGQLLNYTNVANDSQVAVSTVRDYYQVLEDTLLGKQLLAWTGSKKRKAIAVSKFYFFDTGVARILQGRRTLDRNSSDFGEAFETYLCHELRSYIDYAHAGRLDLNYWRSTSSFEVDFILGRKTAIEVKASQNVTSKMLKGLKALQEEKFARRHICVCLENVPRKMDGIEILPFRLFLQALWQGEFD
jgi:uncharacterized protein